MLIRSAAAAVNGLLVLSLYLAAFGVPSPVIGLLEVVLAQAAAVATWFALGSSASRPLALFGRSRAAIPAWSIPRAEPSQREKRAVGAIRQPSLSSTIGRRSGAAIGAARSALAARASARLDRALSARTAALVLTLALAGLIATLRSSAALAAGFPSLSGLVAALGGAALAARFPALSGLVAALRGSTLAARFPALSGLVAALGGAALAAPLLAVPIALVARIGLIAAGLLVLLSRRAAALSARVLIFLLCHRPLLARGVTEGTTTFEGGFRFFHETGISGMRRQIGGTLLLAPCFGLPPARV